MHQHLFIYKIVAIIHTQGQATDTHNDLFVCETAAIYSFIRADDRLTSGHAGSPAL
jgi:hypothetical protein